jgi:hypothetical protein
VVVAIAAATAATTAGGGIATSSNFQDKPIISVGRLLRASILFLRTD